MTTRYTGWLRNGPNGIYGELRDEWGWTIVFEGTKGPPATGYILRGEGAYPPKTALHIEGLDEPKAEG
jgi:hypothetical protein